MRASSLSASGYKPLSPGNDPRTLSRQLIVAHFAPTGLGHRAGIVRGDLPLRNLCACTIIVPGALLTADEVVALTAWVQSGGRLVWHGIDACGYGQDAACLIGADAADLRAPRADGVDVFGSPWSFREFSRDILVEVLP